MPQIGEKPQVTCLRLDETGHWVWHTTRECGGSEPKCPTGWYTGLAEGHWYHRPPSVGLWRMIRFAGPSGGRHYLAISADHLRERTDNTPPQGAPA
jgi:hypothetical protein